MYNNIKVEVVFFFSFFFKDKLLMGLVTQPRLLNALLLN